MDLTSASDEVEAYLTVVLDIENDGRSTYNLIVRVSFQWQIDSISWTETPSHNKSEAS